MTAKIKFRMYRYTVEGSGEFPYDMLRYDCSFPDSESNTNAMGTHARERRTVTLIHQHIGPGSWEPCFDRWRSFVWCVTDVQEIN